MAARWEGTRIGPGAKDLAVGIAYVTDKSLLEDEHLDFKKCVYLAIGISHETSSRQKLKPLKNLLAGMIGRALGKDKRS